MVGGDWPLRRGCGRVQHPLPIIVAVRYPCSKGNQISISPLGTLTNTEQPPRREISSLTVARTSVPLCTDRRSESFTPFTPPFRLPVLALIPSYAPPHRTSPNLSCLTFPIPNGEERKKKVLPTTLLIILAYISVRSTHVND